MPKNGKGFVKAYYASNKIIEFFFKKRNNYPKRNKMLIVNGKRNEKNCQQNIINILKYFLYKTLKNLCYIKPITIKLN